MEENEFLQKLGLQIKKLRLEQGLTQSELAARIDKDQQSIQRLEKGRVNPTIFYLVEVAEGLEISLSDLCNI